MKFQCESDDKSAGSEKQQGGGAASWSVSLERLLAEPAGVHALAAFLEREFSAENIRFWTACERWSRSPPGVRPALAVALHARHLADGAADPVNVDASARHLAAERLPLAPPDLFLQAQKQIFNLMKFDSYPRFIKSDVYKECLLAELQGRPQPYPGDPDLAVGSFSGPSKVSV